MQALQFKGYFPQEDDNFEGSLQSEIEMGILKITLGINYTASNSLQ